MKQGKEPTTKFLLKLYQVIFFRVSYLFFAWEVDNSSLIIL